MHLMTLDKSSLKIDLESIIESKTPLMIDFQFWDRFRALGSQQCEVASLCVFCEFAHT